MGKSKQKITTNEIYAATSKLSKLGKAKSLDLHIQGLQQAGILSIPEENYTAWKPVAHRPGALARFLGNREADGIVVSER